MQFFGEISEFEIKRNQLQLHIPHYHRAATGLLSHTSVYQVPRVIKNRNNQLVKEIILTPYPPSTWLNLYRLEYIAKDRPGVNNELTEILAKLEINIYTQESITTDKDELHKVALIVDIKDMNLKYEKDRSEIKNKLTDQIKEWLKKMESDIVLERVKEIEFLHDNHFSNANHNLIAKNGLRAYFSIDRFKRIIERSVDIESRLLDDLSLIGPNITTDREVQGTIMSDTEEKYVLVRIFDQIQFVIHLDIVHDNKPGSIHEFTQIIKQVNSDFNIDSCYNRIENVKDTAHWRVMLNVTAEPEKSVELIEKLITGIKHIHRVDVIAHTSNFEGRGINIPESKVKRQKRLRKDKAILKDKIEIESLQKEKDNLIAQQKSLQKTIEKNSSVLGSLVYLLIVVSVVLLANLIPDDLQTLALYIKLTVGLVGFIAAITTLYKNYVMKQSKVDW